MFSRLSKTKTAMSISTKTVRGNKYLVFQWYQDGVQRFEYLGREDSVEAWEKGLQRIRAYQQLQLSEIYERIPEAVRGKIWVGRRLLEEREEMTQLSSPEPRKQLLEVLPKMRFRSMKLPPRKRTKRRVEAK